MNIAIFLDEVMPINGALMLIPKSHKKRRAGRRTRQGHHVVSAMDARQGNGDAACRRRRHRGADRKTRSVLMFHGNLVHASPPNITPYPRKIVYLTLCAVSNHITKFTVEEWIAHRDFAPLCRSPTTRC